jgi:hypothetical protein
MNKFIALTAGLFIPFFIRPILIDHGVGAEVIVPMLLGAVACGVGLFVLIAKETEEA